jgi:hypothetical protein
MVHVLCLRTFQEKVFARRTLSFFDLVSFNGVISDICPKSLYWECQHTWWYDWHPAAATGSRRSLYKVMGYRPLSTTYQANWPDFHRYQELCQSYSRRDFTRDSDVVVAFTGAATLLAKSFSGGILYGLPTLFFDIALLWDHGVGSKVRKWDATYDESNRPPSWSWMSWHGELQADHWLSAFRGISYDYSLSTGDIAPLVITPLVQWYFTGAGGAQIAITNEYHKYEHLTRDNRADPPPRWSQTRCSRASSSMYGKKVFNTPDAPGVEFSFPIPLVDSTCTETTIPMPISNQIRCQTQRTYFYLPETNFQFQESHILWKEQWIIIDACGGASGVMALPRNWQKPYSRIKMTVELIAISAGSMAGSHRVHERHIPECCYKLGGIREFYNVLWIEWADGVAYRKAIGQVTKAAWEAADRELIDVVLG